MDPVIADGQEFFTGLQQPPVGFVSAMPAFEDNVPQLTRDEVLAKAAATPRRGKERFGPEWILNQNPRNSCAGYGGATALGKSRVRRGLPPVVLSGAYPYSKTNGHRDKGAMLEDVMEALQKYGSPPLSLVNKDMIYPEQQPANADVEAARNKADVIYAIKSELGLWTALARDFDVVVAVDVNNAFMKMDGNGIAGGGTGVGNHCVSADGLYLVNGILTADHCGSWGTGIHDQGRAGLTWDRHFRYTFNYHQFYVVSSVIDDPQGNNPPVTP